MLGAPSHPRISRTSACVIVIRIRPPARSAARNSALHLPQNPEEHRSESLVLLAIDQQLGEGAAPWVGPELTDPLGPLEVGQDEDVEKLGVGSRRDGIETLLEPAFQFIRTHGPETTPLVRRLRWRIQKGPG